MADNDDSDSLISNVYSENSEDDVPPPLRPRELLEDGYESEEEDDDEVGPEEARKNYQNLYVSLSEGVYYRAKDYHAKQAGAEDVRLLQGQVNDVRSLTTDMRLVRAKLLHHQRINAAQNNEDTPEHQAIREADAEAVDIAESLLTRPTLELDALTRELERVQTLQERRVTHYEEYAARDTKFLKETAGGLGDSARFLHHDDARCVRHYVPPVILIMINVSVKLTRRQIMEALGVQVSNQGVIAVLTALVGTGFLRLHGTRNPNTALSYDLNPSHYCRLRLPYDLEFHCGLNDITELTTRIQEFLAKYRAGRRQFRLGPPRDPAAPDGTRVRGATLFTSPPPAQRRRLDPVVLVTRERNPAGAHNGGADPRLHPRAL